MHPIKTDDELSRLHLQRRGYIYNDYSGTAPSGAIGNKLHAAGCGQIKRCDTSRPKYFFDSHAEAIAWLKANRGVEDEQWSQCKQPSCIGEQAR